MRSYLHCCFLTALIVGGCALPRPAPVSFVSDREQLAAEITGTALVDYQSSRYADAMLGFEQVRYLFPQSETATFNLAGTLVNLGLYDRAEAMLRAMEQSHPLEPKYKSALANLSYARGDFETALRRYEDLVRFAEERQIAGSTEVIRAASVELKADSLRSISVLRFKQGRELPALCASNDALLIRSLRPDILHHGRLLLAMNRVDEADVFLSGHLAAGYAKDGYALHLVSLVRMAQGRYDDAFEVNRRADIFGQRNDDLDYEIRLVKTILFDLSDAAKKDFASSGGDDADEREKTRLDEREQLLNDPRLEGEASLYWPVKFVEAVNVAVEAEREREEKEKDDFLRF